MRYPLSCSAQEKCELERQLFDAQRRIEAHQSQLAALLEERNAQCSRATSPRSLATVDTQGPSLFACNSPSDALRR